MLVIIVIIANPQTGQAQISWEPVINPDGTHNDPPVARELLSKMVELIDQQYPNGKTPAASRLIIPATVIPPNITPPT
jgi:hypothetical protein